MKSRRKVFWFVAAIAVFEPDEKGGYQFVTAKDGNVNQIIIHKKAYDVIWFAGVETEYATVIYTIENQAWDPIQYDTANMDLWYHEAPKQYDAQGNEYQ